MTITALLFAAYAEALGSHSVRLELETGATVGDALAGLRSLPGGDKLPSRPLVAVNLSYASLDQALLPADELAIIPPVAEVEVRGAIVSRPLDPAAILAEVSSNANGAAVLFVGTVREINEGRPVTGVEYSAYEAMAQRELASIVAECARHFGVEHLAVEHRTGELAVGEASVVIAAAHPHRAQAFDAARYVIEEIKKRLPIWKMEQYITGERAWVGASSSATARPVAGTGA